MKLITTWNTILLTGGSLDNAAQLTQLPGAKKELSGIKNLFKGFNVSTYDSDESAHDLIHSTAYGESDLLHFASHGLINLEYPELSKLILPGQSDAGISNYLTPFDVRQSSLSAKLVVLSACETTGVNSFTFDSNLGFVSEFLHSGAGAVVASLWPVPDTFTQEFMLEFYSALLQGISAPEALAEAKRRYHTSDKGSDDLNWSSFQIYFR